MRFLEWSAIAHCETRHHRPTALSQCNHLILRTETNILPQSRLLSDVCNDDGSSIVMTNQRALALALIAKMEWQAWPELFCSLANPQSLLERRVQMIFTLHVVLKELANVRIGSHVDAFAIVGKDLMPQLLVQLESLQEFLKVVDATPGKDLCPRLAVWLCKCINSLLRGCTSVADLPLLGRFLEMGMFACTEPDLISDPWRCRLLKNFRKSVLIMIKSHPKAFTPYFSAFAQSTVQVLQQTSSADTENPIELRAALFALAYWTETLGQKWFHNTITDASSTIDQAVTLVIHNTIRLMCLTRAHFLERAELGGEVFTLQDSDGEVLFSSGGGINPKMETELRPACRRLVQTCLDQASLPRREACVKEIFASDSRNDSQTEAAYLGFQLCAFRMHKRMNFLDFTWSRLLPCLRGNTSNGNVLAPGGAAATAATAPAVPPTSLRAPSSVLSIQSSACLRRRACCVIEAWKADLPNDPAVLGRVFEAMCFVMEHDSDLGVAMAAVSTLSALVEENSWQLGDWFFACFRFPAVCALLDRVETSESKVSLLDLVQIVFVKTAQTTSSVNSSAKFLLCDFVPRLWTSVVEAAGLDGLVEGALLELTKTCVNVVGFQTLDEESKRVVFRLLELVSKRDYLDWASLFLSCLKTSTEFFPAFGQFLTKPAFVSMNDYKVRCRIIDSAAILLTMSTTKVAPGLIAGLDFVTPAVELFEFAFVHKQRKPSSFSTTVSFALQRETSGGRPASPRSNAAEEENNEDPFLFFEICVCLETLLKSKCDVADARLAGRLWSTVLSVACKVERPTDDERDFVQLLSVASRAVVERRATFKSLEAAKSFSASCIELFDALGYTPKGAPKRRRLWTAALISLCSQCETISQLSHLLRYPIEACYILAEDDVDDVNASSVNDAGFVESTFDCGGLDHVSRKIDFDRNRRDEAMKRDPYLEFNRRTAFTRMWNEASERYGSRALENAGASIKQDVGANVFAKCFS